MEEKKPETGIELLKQKLAERREQMGYEEEVSPQAEEAEEYYIKSMVMQGIRDIVRGKRNKTIRKNRDKYLAQLLSEWPPKHHDKVKEYAEAQLAKYEK